MERTTRLIVVIGAVALLAAHLIIGRAWSGMAVTATVTAAACALLSLWRRESVALILLAGCLVPPLVWFSLETFGVQFWILWMAALLGAMLPRLLTTPWQAPPRFRAPLVLAALSIVVAAPIVMLREIDFNPALLGDMPGAVLSGLPWFSCEWILQVAVTALVGLLWFDWLCGAIDLDVEIAVIAPLTVSLACSSLVALYQMFVTVTFLNETIYGGIGRAAGTMFDANVNGVLAAAGIGLSAFLAAGRAHRRLWLLLIPLFLLAVWASGSRTGFGATVVILFISTLSWWRHASGSNSPVNRWLVVGGGAVVLTGVAVAVLSIDTTTVGPLQRFAKMLPGAGGQSGRSALAELWNRNGYGAAATVLIERFPLSGIGLGGFHLFGPPLTPIGVLPPDNAQNWLRHQLVEMGVLGGLGWVLFAILFGVYVLRPWRGADPRLNHLRGVILAFAAISLFGVPTQEILPSIVFWVTAAALVRLHDDRREAPAQAALTTIGQSQVPAHAALSRPVLVAIAIVTVAFGAVTWQLAHTRLRVPVRARQLGFPYSYGFFAAEGEGGGGRERWMSGRATELVDIRGPFMRLAVKSPLPDMARHPVRLRAWVEGRRVLDAQLASDALATTMVRMPVGLKQVVLDLEVSRTVRPRDVDAASQDARELGALVSWTFTAAGD